MNWQEKYGNKMVSFTEAAKKVKSGDKVVFQQAHGEARNLMQAIVDRAPELENVTLLGHLHWGPTNYSKPGMEKFFRVISPFLSPNIRQDYLEGRVDILPMHFNEMACFYEQQCQHDFALITVSEPDGEGFCSFGLSADYAVSIARGAKNVIAHVNPSYPRVYGEKIHLDDIAWIVYKDEDLVEVVPKPPREEDTQIGRWIANEVVDGATLQMGIGGIPDAMLQFLADKKDLGIHSELFSDGVMDLFERGIITNRCKKIDTGKIVTTFISGTRKVFEFARENPHVLLREVAYTNNPYIIAQNDDVVSINQCLMTDLHGQVVSDSLNGKALSGIGGQVDFVRGAKMSKRGKSILAMKSTAKNGAISTIVPQLPAGSLITVSRYDVQYICTEYGIVNLFGLTVSERAKALISIAHPKFREQLERDAYEIGLF